MGILDYLAPRFKGPVVIAESAGNPLGAYEALGYSKIVDQHRGQNVSLVALNTEAKYQVIPVFDYSMHEDPRRPGGDAVGKEHGLRRRPFIASRGDASLE